MKGNESFTVSVITICLNAEKCIEQAIASVKEQTYPKIEYLVIDGGSTDDTLAIVERHKERVDYLVSEPDAGLYNAMNKGIQAATGDVLFFLNADDRLHDSAVIEDIMRAFSEEPNLELVYGDVVLDWAGDLQLAPQPPAITRKTLARTTICHQSIFSRKEIFERTRGFSEHYQVVSDYEWLLKAALDRPLSSLHIARPISVIGTDGRTYTTDWKEEKHEVMRRYYTPREIYCYRTIPREIIPAILRKTMLLRRVGRWPIHLLKIIIISDYRSAWIKRKQAHRSNRENR